MPKSKGSKKGGSKKGGSKKGGSKKGGRVSIRDQMKAMKGGGGASRRGGGIRDQMRGGGSNGPVDNPLDELEDEWFKKSKSEECDKWKGKFVCKIYYYLNEYMCYN